jgi:hypothetical protein
MTERMAYQPGQRVEHKALHCAGEVIATYGDAAKVRWANRKVPPTWVAMSALVPLDREVKP